MNIKYRKKREACITERFKILVIKMFVESSNLSLFSFYRTDSASAEPDNLKYSSSRDRGGSSYGLQPSNSAVVSRQRHDDTRVHADIQNDEKGTYI